MEKTQFPILKWAQRKNCLYITINVVHTTKPKVDIVDGNKLIYSGTDGLKKYAFEIELFDEVNKDESKYNLDSRNAFLNIKKKTEGPFWPRLTKDNIKRQWIQVDWTYFVEEEDDDERPPAPNFDGMNFGNPDEMDEDDELKDDHECDCGHEHHHHDEHKDEEKKTDLSDLDKAETK